MSFVTYDEKTLKLIYDKNSGRCVYDNEDLLIANYGKSCEKGAWEVDHSRPVSRGGTDHMDNLVPACFFCNREKADMTASEFSDYIAKNFLTIDDYRQKMRKKYCR